MSPRSRNIEEVPTWRLLWTLQRLEAPLHILGEVHTWTAPCREGWYSRTSHKFQRNHPVWKRLEFWVFHYTIACESDSDFCAYYGRFSHFGLTTDVGSWKRSCKSTARSFTGLPRTARTVRRQPFTMGRAVQAPETPTSYCLWSWQRASLLRLRGQNLEPSPITVNY